MVDIERVARVIAAHHYNRRMWTGSCTKAERTQWLVDRYWREFEPVARDILEMDKIVTMASFYPMVGV